MCRWARYLSRTFLTRPACEGASPCLSARITVCLHPGGSLSLPLSSLSFFSCLLVHVPLLLPLGSLIPSLCHIAPRLHMSLSHPLPLHRLSVSLSSVQSLVLRCPPCLSPASLLCPSGSAHGLILGGSGPCPVLGRPSAGPGSRQLLEGIPSGPWALL